MPIVAAPSAAYAPRVLVLEAGPPRGFDPRLLPAIDDITEALRSLILSGLEVQSAEEFIAFWTQPARWSWYRSLLDAYFGLRLRIAKDGFGHVLDIEDADIADYGAKVERLFGDEGHDRYRSALAIVAATFAQLENLRFEPSDVEKDRALRSEFEDYMALHSVALNSILAAADDAARPTRETAAMLFHVLGVSAKQVRHVVDQALILRSDAIDAEVARLASDRALVADVEQAEDDLKAGRVIAFDELVARLGRR